LSCALIAPWIGRTAPAARPRNAPAGALARRHLERASAGLGSYDQPGADNDGSRAGERCCLVHISSNAEPAEAVEQERGEHLAGDEQPDRDERAEAREEQDAGGDVDGAAEAADEVPGLNLIEEPEGTERAGQRREREEHGRPDRELQGRGAEGADHSRRELHVGGRLQDQQAADEQQERDREAFHWSLPA
jgi:hypothetical protein